MINKIIKNIKKWLGIPEDLIYRIKILNDWSMENERRRHLLHNETNGLIEGLKRMSEKIRILEQQVEQFEKKEHALRRFLKVKYEEFFTYDTSKAPKIQHYSLVPEDKEVLPQIKDNLRTSLADEKFIASVTSAI